MKFLFWNIQGKPLAHLVRALVDEHDIDVVILAEWGGDRWAILNPLNRDRTQHLFHTDDLPEPARQQRALPPRVFGRFPKEIMVQRRDDPGAFDQVLVRPDLLDVFDASSLQILERAGEVALLDPHSGRLNQHDASDHLPILFALRVEGGNVHDHA